MKKYIWFDLGYTLVYLNREKAYQQALNETGINLSLEKIERGFHFADKLFMREFHGLFGHAQPGAFMPWFIGRMNYQLGIKVDIYEIMERWMALRNAQPRQWEPYDFSRDTLMSLRADGYKTGLISNWDSTARPILDDLGLTKYLDTIVISSEAGFEKPSPKIFNRAFELSGSSPDEGLYVGDNYYDDALGSLAVGMDYCIVNRFGRFGVEELDHCRIISDVREVGTVVEELG